MLHFDANKDYYSAIKKFGAGQIPQKSLRNVANRRFLAKLAKCENLHSIESTASTSPILHKDKDDLRDLSKHAYNKSKMADDRHIEKVDKSPLIDRREISTMTHIDVCTHIGR